MHTHHNNIENMFSSEKGREVYDRIVRTIDNEGMRTQISDGVLVGLSGGADSVFLLCFLIEYKKREKDFPLLAIHINHCLRGEEANRDECFSKQFANDLGVEFAARRIDVNKIRDELGIGVEEAARKARYSVFNEIIKGRNDISTISVAHNATDNAETVLMNILRGSGLNGVCGIKPVRENVIRPLICVSKNEILSLLDEYHIPYVCDSTNFSVDYTRNYVRNEILPLLKHLSCDPESSFTRLSDNLRMELNFLNKSAQDFIDAECSNGIFASKIRALHPAMQSRVLSILVHKNTGIFPEEKHLHALRDMLNTDNFSFSLPGKSDFICQRGNCFFSPKNEKNDICEQIFSLNYGENKISGTNLTVYIGEIDKTSLNVYNFSIQALISSDIINSGLTLRFKTNGDSYKYSGITHKLKKVFNDRDIPPIERPFIPLVTDPVGIVVVPGMSVRDGAKSDINTQNIPITFAYKSCASGETELFSALKRDKQTT